MSETASSRFQLVFLHPLIHRPLKENFAGKFVHLAAACRGYIFALCSTPYHDARIAHFRLYAQEMTSHLLRRWARALWVQVLLPMRLLWRQPPIDAVIVYDPYVSGFAGLLLKLLLRTKLIIEINGDYHRLEPSKQVLKRQLMRWIFTMTIRFADGIKVLNKDQEAFFHASYPAKPVYRFPDYVAIQYFESLQLVQGDYLLSIGYPFALKGMDVLIQAFLLIAAKYPHIKLKIMGYCPEGDMLYYKRLAQHHPHIEFVPPGWIEDVGEQMRGCYALVNAARSEAMGRVHLEAMACQKPIVATRTNGGMTCVQDGRTGLLCDIDSVHDLADKLDSILANPERAVHMGQAGFALLQEAFSEECYTQAFLAMVQDVVSHAHTA